MPDRLVSLEAAKRAIHELVGERVCETCMNPTRRELAAALDALPEPPEVAAMRDKVLAHRRATELIREDLGSRAPEHCEDDLLANLSVLREEVAAMREVALAAPAFHEYMTIAEWIADGGYNHHGPAMIGLMADANACAEAAALWYDDALARLREQPPEPEATCTTPNCEDGFVPVTHPDGGAGAEVCPERHPGDVLCEDCDEPATRRSADGVPLCARDYEQLLQDAESLPDPVTLDCRRCGGSGHIDVVGSPCPSCTDAPESGATCGTCRGFTRVRHVYRDAGARLEYIPATLDERGTAPCPDCGGEDR